MSTAISTPIIFECGSPEGPIYLDPNRLIDIVSLLPEYLKESETNDVTIFFQNFLNTLYDDHTLTTSSTDWEKENSPKISILEKINRLANLHNPEEIDITFIQFLANYLGYSVNLNAGDLGILENGDPNDPDTINDANRYLRFIVSNLPNWYKIKTTSNAIKIMLYSFGLIGDLVTRWTNDYKTDVGNNWYNFREEFDSISNIPEDFYPTSHFVIFIKLDEARSTFLDPNNSNQIFNAIASIKPINSVFDGAWGFIERSGVVYMKAMMRTSYYIKIT